MWNKSCSERKEGYANALINPRRWLSTALFIWRVVDSYAYILNWCFQFHWDKRIISCPKCWPITHFSLSITYPPLHRSNFSLYHYHFTRLLHIRQWNTIFIKFQIFAKSAKVGMDSHSAQVYFSSLKYIFCFLKFILVAKKFGE